MQTQLQRTIPGLWVCSLEMLGDELKRLDKNCVTVGREHHTKLINDAKRLTKINISQLSEIVNRCMHGLSVLI